MQLGLEGVHVGLAVGVDGHGDFLGDVAVVQAVGLEQLVGEAHDAEHADAMG